MLLVYELILMELFFCLSNDRFSVDGLEDLVPSETGFLKWVLHTQMKEWKTLIA